MTILNNPVIHRCWPPALIAALAIQLGPAYAADGEHAETTIQPTGLMGNWCREKKRMITQYSVKKDTLFIRGGRSGRTHEASLNCNDTYTECKAQTVRGWGTPVTEILRLDGEKMNLTRIWGGAWKDKTYNFTFVRCPKF